MTDARRVDYDDHQHRVYSRARPLLPENAERWSEVFRRHLPARGAIVDVGSGTGIYTALLARALDAEVTGVEPSKGMRSVAEREQADPRVRYLPGRAEELPLADASCDAVLLSNVIHHVKDRDATTAELGRVLRPGGAVLVRGALRDTLAGGPHWHFFPAALALALDTTPSVDDVVDLFTGAGFELVATEQVHQPTAYSLRDFTDKIAMRAISYLELIDDDLFEAGMRQLRAAADAETEPRPVMERVDVVVLRS